MPSTRILIVLVNPGLIASCIFTVSPSITRTTSALYGPKAIAAAEGVNIGGSQPSKNAILTLPRSLGYHVRTHNQPRRQAQ